MDKSNSISTPMSQHFRLSALLWPTKDKDGEDMSHIPYAQDVGCLICIMVCTRLDIAQAISVLIKYMPNRGNEHWNAVK